MEYTYLANTYSIFFRSYIINVNDMPGAVKHKLLLYVDDSAILVSGKCRHDIENVLSSEMAVLESS